jgi:hypothetical protein
MISVRAVVPWEEAMTRRSQSQADEVTAIHELIRAHAWHSRILKGVVIG